ncbi:MULTISPECIES: shikimate kinase [Pseudoxanthomonas]|jgi:shikimate kinase|uniref:Shikimate kinase n=1 Tax=Pseudoxanthomonas winnipegensis TaxID=2480810 RepID=A0A4Q8LLB4_9GAMM|nr:MULTISPECIES: shikimate kinase [Pseudoxanthomonas]MDQ1118209.1 shikimate kinase [Pseudoxanthomonas winnipegensis]MDQ1135182.1 shikimate kinase [Pseudoxanthomonas winnipegensis]MDR6138591.1 shikimate kinase [Pseudoxanthomonas sp. SORGH_AS_0997]RZZ83597.1 shikimate kinase [Pseudoxanthomonas winnipegensis]RZZ86213.1 shikimate kinase [Pseudoxanthomonas winnipegensis]
MNPAPNLVMVGPMGAGKTSIGRRIAERFGLRFVDADHAVVEAAGSSIPEIFEHEGEAGFRARERAALAQLLAGEGQVVASGGGAVLDADNRALMQARGFVIYLRVDVETQLRRVARDRNRPLLQNVDRRQVLTDLIAVRDPLYRQVADLVLDADRLTPGEATAALVGRLARDWQPTGASTA